MPANPTQSESRLTELRATLAHVEDEHRDLTLGLSEAIRTGNEGEIIRLQEDIENTASLIRNLGVEIANYSMLRADRASEVFSYRGMFLDEADEDEEMEPLNFGCSNCGREMTPQNEGTFRWEGDCCALGCDECHASHYFVCLGCSNEANTYSRVSVITSFQTGAQENLCQSCAQRGLEAGAYGQCRHCGTFYTPTSSDRFMADRCHSCIQSRQNSGEIVYRRYRNEPSLIGTDRGEYVKSTRAFGIELETIMKSGQKAAKASNDLASYIGVAQDNSIQVDGNSGYGVEIQTPPATGIQAEVMISEARDILVKNGFTINETCGYHVHIDVATLDRMSANDQLNAVKRLWLVYLAYEDVLLSFLPPSRRQNKGRDGMNYCQPLRSEYHVNEIVKARNMDELETLWYRITNKQEVTRAKNEHRHASRYRGINLHPLFGGRHLEIRYHTGTLNLIKILEWANLHIKITDWAMGGSLNDWGFFKDRSNSIDLQSKTNELFRIADLGENAQAYFLARQDRFKPKEKARGEKVKNAMKILEEEKEN